MEHELYGAEDAAIAARATRDDDAQEASEQAIAREAPKRGSERLGRRRCKWMAQR